MTPNIGIKAKDRQQVAEDLSKILADEFIIYTKTLKSHWNVEGPDFHDKHLLFESQYKALTDVIDDVAERIRTIGHYAPATLGEFLKLTALSEEGEKGNTGLILVKELLSDHEQIIIRLRGLIESFDKEQEDKGTSDFITGLMEKHEKMAWFLRAHLK